MKNKGPIIFLIMILSIIIIGLIALLYIAVSSKINFLSEIRTWGTKSSNIIFDTSYELEAIDDLEVLSSAGDISIKESTDKKIRVVAYGQNNEDLKVSLEEKKLKLDYSNYRNIRWGFKNYINDIIIYIPKDYSKEINLDADYGDIDVNDLENAAINIEEDCGDVKLGKIKNVSIKNDYGDIEIESILNKFTIESSCGDIKIASIAIKENSSIKSEYGDVNIEETNDIYIDAKTDLGEVKVNKNNRYSKVFLKIENSCGDISVKN